MKKERGLALAACAALAALMLLFASQWSIQWVQDKNKDLKLAEFGGAKF